MYVKSPNAATEAAYLTDLGYSGSLGDMQRKFLLDAGYSSATLNDMLKDYLETVHGVSWTEALKLLRSGSVSPNYFLFLENLDSLLLENNDRIIL